MVLFAKNALKLLTEEHNIQTVRQIIQKSQFYCKKQTHMRFLVQHLRQD